MIDFVDGLSNLILAAQVEACRGPRERSCLPAMSERQTVAVIGAGFSGLLTALRLLLDPDGPRVILIERGARFGRGASYSTSSSQHLLNVRATNMSAFVEQPDHFLDWLATAGDE